MNRKFNILVLFLLISGFAVHAGEPDSLCYPCPKVNKPYFKSYWSDAKAYGLSPLRWKAGDWLTLGATVAAGAAIYRVDEHIRKSFLEKQNPGFQNLNRYVLEPVGGGEYTIPLMAGLYFGGRFAGNNRLSATTLSAAKAALFSAAVARITKQVTHRHRPYQDDPAQKYYWDGPFSNIHYTSFPSGHATFIWTVAVVYASEYRRNIWVPVLAYSLAAASSLSRVYDDKHWMSDVFAGAALGYFTGRFVWKRNRCLQVFPAVSDNGVSLGFVYSIR